MAFQNDHYDVVLVQPPAESRREHWDTPDYPAIGIAYVGAWLETEAGITPAIVDAKLARLDLTETIDLIVSLGPRVVGLSAMTHMIDGASDLAQGIKARLPEAKMVLGGFHGTFLPERTKREFPVFDYIVVGEGEMAFAALTQKILAGEEPENINGLCYEKNGDIVTIGRGDVPETLDELGEPAWHLFDPEALAKYARVVPVMSQRGCPFFCNFCSRPYGRTVRLRTPELVVDEIERNLKRLGATYADFYDETFTVNKPHTRGICEGLIKRGLSQNLLWKCMAHANTVDRDLVHLMRKAGCDLVGFGVETGNKEILASMQKGVTKERTMAARMLFKEAGIPTQAFFLMGHPNESKKSLFDTMMFAIRMNAEESAIGIMVPYPGTEVWEMATKGEGGYKKLSGSWRDYNKQLGNAVELENVSRRQLEIFQIATYILVFVVNFRALDLLRMIGEHWRLALPMLWKAIAPKRFSPVGKSGRVL
ncbi:MAG: cobalamin B12-binding domain-containing protein [Rhodospirillales bacterium]|nr:cobalamin B12-binding domain-containing protein [Rhodospirillales bacterium]